MIARIAAIGGRIMLAILFILAGVNKLLNLDTTQAYIEGVSVLPSFLALPAALFEIFGGMALAVGLWPRIVAPAMAVFTLLTIVFFHYDTSSTQEMALAMKNLAIAGGLFMVFAHAEATRTVVAG
ncbi:DoxX family protein [Altererythrobacter sp. MTPC7]|uniref:DoxX family protein n=1 Tax=Altererythrobacter sp. MTPC7 TaxID=3056567 RepID=UPI0036F1FE3B